MRRAAFPGALQAEGIGSARDGIGGTAGIMPVARPAAE